ncbi:MAG: hypothetical protein AAF962_21765 [Actinomycetota bacterium]
MKTTKLAGLVAALLLVAAACGSDGDGGGGDQAAITPGVLICEVAEDDSFFRILYGNDSGGYQRIVGDVTLTLTNGGEHVAEVQSEAVKPDEVLRESYFAAKPSGTTVADCAADDLMIETATPAESGLADLSPCALTQGEYGDFMFELTATNNGSDTAIYNGQVAIRNQAGERVITGFYLFSIVGGAIQTLEPGQAATESFSALGAPFQPDHSCELLSADRIPR